MKPAGASTGVVIPFHFGGEFVVETIDALREQTHDRWTAVIVVDGATAEENELLGAEVGDDDRFRLESTTGSVGPAAARNIGARAVGDCENLLFLDCDDILRPDALSVLSRALEHAPESPVAYGLPQYLGDAPAAHRPKDIGEWSRHRMRVERGSLVPVAPAEPTAFAALVTTNWIATPGQALIRRSAFDAVNGFSETVPRAVEDWDLWLRLAVAAPLAFIDEVVLLWRQHGGSLSNDGSVMQEKEDAYRRSLAADPALDDEHRRLVTAGRTAELRRRRASKLRQARSALRERDVVEATREVLRAAKLTYRIRR